MWRSLEHIDFKIQIKRTNIIACTTTIQTRRQIYAFRTHEYVILDKDRIHLEIISGISCILEYEYPMNSAGTTVRT